MFSKNNVNKLSENSAAMSGLKESKNARYRHAFTHLQFKMYVVVFTYDYVSILTLKRV